MKNQCRCLVLVAFLLTSCEEVFIPGDPTNDPITNFDILWHELDRKYSFFELKKIDWDSVYNVYRPMVTNDMSRYELFDVMADMLNTLRDGHVNLRSEFNISKYEDWFLDYPANADPELVMHSYLGEAYEITGPFLHTEIGGVGYVIYRSFRSMITHDDLDYIFGKYDNSRGIIFDIRSNEGGTPANGFRLISRLIDRRTLLYRHAFKNGPAHDAFEPLREIYIEPDQEHKHYANKFVVLTNRRVYSAGNYFAAMCKVVGIPLIGDHTGGGGGVPAGSELPNGFHVNYSSSICFLPNGYNIEAGIPPDIRVDLLPEDQAQGIDTIIERALQEF